MFKKFLNKPFTLLDSYKNRWLLIITTGIYAILFMNLFVPFNVNINFSYTGFQLFLFLSSFGFTGSLILVFTNFIVRKKIKSFTWKSYIVWFIFEMVLLTVVLFFIHAKPIKIGLGLFYEVLFYNVRYVFLVYIVPYIGSLFYFHYREKNQNFQKLLQKSSSASKEIKTGLINFYDEKEVFKFSLQSNSILYIESSDNYVTIHYLNEEKPAKILLRNSLKKLENELTAYKIIRCYRSYMVNIQYIEVVKHKGKGLRLMLKHHIQEIIPVSKNYAGSVLQQLQ